MLMRCAVEGWFQFLDVLLAVPNLVVHTAADVDDEGGQAAAASAAGGGDGDDFLADVDDSAATAALLAAAERRKAAERVSFCDPLELLRACATNRTARVMLTGVVCRHWSKLRLVEYSRVMLPIWTDLVRSLCSSSRALKGEDRASRMALLQKIVSLNACIPIDINAVDPNDGNSLVSRSVAEGEVAVYQTLTKRSDDVIWDVVLPDGHSLLTLACACSQRAIVELLVANPLIDIEYEVPGQGTALDIIRVSGGGNKALIDLLEARQRELDDIRAKQQQAKQHEHQSQNKDALRRRMRARQRAAARPIVIPAWIAATAPTGPVGVDVEKDADWIYDRESKPVTCTGPVLDVINTLREHWHLTDVTRDANGNVVRAADAQLTAAAANDENGGVTALPADDDDADDDDGGAADPEVTHVQGTTTDADGAATATTTTTTAVAVSGESSSSPPRTLTSATRTTMEQADEDYLANGALVRADLAATVAAMGTRIVVEGKDPKEKVYAAVKRLVGEGSAVPGSLKLARMLMFRVATVDFAPSIGGSLKWALHAAKRGDLEALETVLRVDKLWREEQEVVELVACCVRHYADKIALTLLLLRHQKQLRFGTYRDHLRPLWEEFVEGLTNPTKMASVRLSERDRALRRELIYRLFANPGFFQFRHDIEISKGLTWFSRACRIGDTDFVQACIDLGVVDVNKVYSNKSTPLMQAIVGNQLEVVKILCACSDIDPFIEGGSSGETNAVDLAQQMKRDQGMIDVLMAACGGAAEEGEAVA